MQHQRQQIRKFVGYCFRPAKRARALFRKRTAHRHQDIHIVRPLPREDRHKSLHHTHWLQSDLRLAQTVAGKHTTTTTPPPMHTSTQARRHASTTTPANEREQAHAYRVYACRVESGQPGHHTCVGVAATLRDFQHDWRTAFLKSHPVQLQWHVTRPRHTKALATSHTTPCGRTASVRTYMIVHEHAQRKHLQQALNHGELRRFAGQISMDGIVSISILRLSCIWEGVNDRH